MDHFGIGVAIRGMLINYRRCARRSGRTTSLIESVKNGDRIVFDDIREAHKVSMLLKDRGVEVECIVIDPKRPHDLLEKHGSVPKDGRTIFDHAWVEKFYEDSIERAIEAIDTLQRETSGFGEVHRETARKAQEIARFREGLRESDEPSGRRQLSWPPGDNYLGRWRRGDLLMVRVSWLSFP